MSQEISDRDLVKAVAALCRVLRHNGNDMARDISVEHLERLTKLAAEVLQERV